MKSLQKSSAMQDPRRGSRAREPRAAKDAARDASHASRGAGESGGRGFRPSFGWEKKETWVIYPRIYQKIGIYMIYIYIYILDELWNCDFQIDFHKTIEDLEYFNKLIMGIWRNFQLQESTITHHQGWDVFGWCQDLRNWRVHVYWHRRTGRLTQMLICSQHTLWRIHV